MFAGDGFQRDHSADCWYSAVYIPAGTAGLPPEGVSVCWAYGNRKICLHYCKYAIDIINYPCNTNILWVGTFVLRELLVIKVN